MNLDKFYFDFVNIEVDDCHHPLDPDDSTHSKILSVYCPVDMSNEEIKNSLRDMIQFYTSDIGRSVGNIINSFVKLEKENKELLEATRDRIELENDYLKEIEELKEKVKAYEEFG